MARGVVEVLDEPEHGDLRFSAGGEAMPVDQLAFERGEEALAYGVVERVTCGAGGRPDARRAAAVAERPGRILGGLVDFDDVARAAPRA